MPIELHVQEDTLRVGICTGIGIKVDIGVGEDEGLAVGVGIGDDVGVGEDDGLAVGVGIGDDVGVGEDDGLAVGVGIGDDVGVGAAGGVGKVIVKISTKSEYPVLLFPPPNNI
jgi:UDP-3-O-[3-hydroxymyristoyl] glucosamine N-acyltransferase